MSTDHKNTAPNAPKSDDKAKVSSTAPAGGTAAKPVEAVKAAIKS
ncbi:hypothetical protein [Nisaea sp.]